MTSTVPWTKLQGTAIWDLARKRYSETFRDFHDFSHPCGMYTAAAEIFDMPYCYSLDMAILMHDYIIDHPAPEEASISAMWSMLPGRNKAADDLIRSTITHTPGQDNRLILLDLHGFIDDRMRRDGTKRLFEEHRRLHKIGPRAFSNGSTAYLTGLHARIKEGLAAGVAPTEFDAFRWIQFGIEKTLAEYEGDEWKAAG